MKTLTVIPLATPQTVPQNSLEAVKSVDRLYLQTTEHICANAALRIRPEAVSMDDLYSECFRFLYKGIIIKHNKTEPTYTKTSLFLCEKRRFFMARTEKGVVTTI